MPPRRIWALVIVASGLAAIVGILFMLARGDEHPTEAVGDLAVGHIHGIGVDPADGQLYIGAHLGMFRVNDDGTIQPVGDERNDTMAFTVAGPNHFIASGHPDLASDQPVHLGLIESRDAATSWKSISLSGAADFHALETSTERTWGVDSVGGQLLSSVDRRDWAAVAEGQFIDIATDPALPDRVLATTGSGRLRSYGLDGATAAVPGAPALTYIDWPTEQELVGLALDATVLVSEDRGNTWAPVGRVPGQPTALEISPTHWYAASDSGLYVSSDDGRTWQSLFNYRGGS